MKNPTTPRNDNELTTVEWFKLAHSTTKDILRETRRQVVQIAIAGIVGASVGSAVALVVILGLEMLCKRL